MSNPKTDGDLLFEDYLRHLGYEDWEYEPDFGVQTLPDYRVTHDGISCACEVTAFARDAGGDLVFAPSARTRSAKEVFSPHRNKFRDCARQLKPLADLRIPLIIVLTNPASALLHLSARDIAWAMYGDPTWEGLIDGATNEIVGSPELVAGPNGKFTGAHSYISGVLRVYRRSLAADYLDELAEINPNLPPNEKYDLLANAIRSGEVDESESSPAAELFLTRSSDAVAISESMFSGPVDRRFRIETDGTLELLSGPPS